MKATNKKELRKKYRLFCNMLITDFENYKKYLSQKDIERIKKADKLITKTLESMIKNIKKELKECVKK